MERTLTLTGLYAKFTKNFDTFGKMEPFLTFKVGPQLQKTQVSQNGLQPVWKATITLNISNQTEIEITSYDEDLTQNEYMGTAKLMIASLKSSGNHSITILDKDRKSIGDVFFKYQIEQPKIPSNPQVSKQITTKKSIQQKPAVVQSQIKTQHEKPTPVSYANSIKITQISAKFTKNFDTFGKMQPFLVFKLGQLQDKTEIFNGQLDEVKWTKSINFGFNKQTQLEIKGYDEDMTENEYIGTSTIVLKSLSKSGKHSFDMIGQDSKSIGTIYFKYQITGLFDSESAPPKQVVAKPIEQTKPKPVEPIKVQQKPKPAPVVQQELKPQHKIVEQRISQRVGKKLTEFSQKQLDKNSINLNTSITKTGQLNKSRDSLKLPDISKNFGDSNPFINSEIYDKQSSSTLQKSIVVYSMPKANRFYTGPKYVGEPSYYVDSAFKPNGTKGAGFGFGNKRQFPEWMEKNMKENPAPGAYFEQPKPVTEVRSKGPTFGISHKFYEKVTIPREKSPQRTVKSNTRLKPILNGK